MDDSMDCTNLKANMVLIHAVCVWAKAPAHGLLEKDFYLDTLMLTRLWEVLHVQLLLSQDLSLCYGRVLGSRGAMGPEGGTRGCWGPGRCAGPAV